ncbi:MAG: biotin synthase BioB [Planctomycetes bacterium]|nr:biotin synthase BioB [Planctomycetota bacterium]
MEERVIVEIVASQSREEAGGMELMLTRGGRKNHLEGGRMNQKMHNELALDICKIQDVLKKDFRQMEVIMERTNALREARFGKEIHLCVIQNVKAGACTEDCTFCHQSRHASHPIEAGELLAPEEIVSMIESYDNTPVNRYSLVSSGYALDARSIKHLASAMHLQNYPMKFCTSFGLLKKDSMDELKKMGVTRYHNNLETGRSYFPNLCTTHKYEQKINTLKEAKSTNMEICCGGLFGVGENDDQIIELISTLAEIKPDAIPLNFYVSPDGSEANSQLKGLSRDKCLAIIMAFRLCFPETEIILAGGRTKYFRNQEELAFLAGASGIMTGNYLTTSGHDISKDLIMLNKLGYTPRF